MKSIVQLSIFGLACAVVAGCNTTSKMELPIVQPVLAPAVTVAKADQPSFTLSGVVVNLRRGEVVAHFPVFGVDGVEGYRCNVNFQGSEATLEWGSGRSTFGNWSTELGEVFFDVMRDSNLNVKGDPNKLFARAEDATSSEYLVGANITKMNANFCQPQSFWGNRPLNKFSGEMFLEVEWTIFQVL